jgi:FixJ family two-component response regulator
MSGVAILDGDETARHSFTCILTSAGYSASSYANVEDFWIGFEACQPHCVLLDLVTPSEAGLAVCRSLASRVDFTVSFAVVAAHADVAMAVEAMRLGAIDVLEKPVSPQALIDMVSRGVRLAKVMRQRQVESREINRRVSTLTPRENEVLHALAEGRISKEIARLFGISARTVDVHRSRIMHKLGLASLNELAHLLSLLQRESYAAHREDLCPRPHFLTTLALPHLSSTGG